MKSCYLRVIPYELTIVTTLIEIIVQVNVTGRGYVSTTGTQNVSCQAVHRHHYRGLYPCI